MRNCMMNWKDYSNLAGMSGAILIVRLCVARPYAMIMTHIMVISGRIYLNIFLKVKEIIGQAFPVCIMPLWVIRGMMLNIMNSGAILLTNPYYFIPTVVVIWCFSRY